MRVFGGALLAVLLVVAGGPVRALGQETPQLPTDVFRLGVRVGVQFFSYEEEEDPVQSDYTSSGPAIGLTGMLRFADRFRLTADWLGSFIAEDGETWRNVDTPAGIGTQHNDLSVDFHVFDVDLGYSVVKRPGLEWAVLLGWHTYSQEFDRSNFRLVSSSVIIAAPGLSVTEDVVGQGLKLGMVAEAMVAPRVWFEGGLAWYYLYDIAVDNSELGRLDSDGYALRWRAALDYLLTPRAAVGVGYEGHFIHVDRATSATAILPENMTWAHTLLVRLGVRF